MCGSCCWAVRGFVRVARGGSRPPRWARSREGSEVGAPRGWHDFGGRRRLLDQLGRRWEEEFFKEGGGALWSSNLGLGLGVALVARVRKGHRMTLGGELKVLSLSLIHT